MVNKMRGKGSFLAVFCNRLTNQFLHLARGHSVRSFGNQVNPMRRQDRNRRASASSRHCGRWKNIIAAETDFSVDLTVNSLFIRVVEEPAAQSPKFDRRLPSIEMERELKLVVLSNELSGC